MSDLGQLKQALDAAWQAQQAGLRQLARQEGELRLALSELDAMRRGAQALPDQQLAAPRAIGADLLWQGWTQRKRQELNMQLAQVLVRKAEKIEALRQAFGRAEAVAELLQSQQAARRKIVQDRDAQARQHLALLQAANAFLA